MRWEKIQTRNGGGQEMGPGKRWGHTCNAVRGGKFLYVFGGYRKDYCQTNQVHVFDTDTQAWSEPVIKGTLPKPRDSHSCTTIGDNLFVFGGTDGNKPLNDLHILDTSSNTWISPYVRGEGPEAREGHSAAVVGKRLFIFGGCGKSSNGSVEEYYDDVYILNTETLVWKRAVTTGMPPAKRDSHTCSSWKNKIIVIGGEDAESYYLSDVHILDTDNLLWMKVLYTAAQMLPPRAGHTTVALGKHLFVFGGFTDEQNLYDDIYMFDAETYLWTKVMATGEGPSARFSMAGHSLDPQQRGVLVFVGGCNKSLEALDDVYYLFTGLTRENDRDFRRLDKLSLRKQLKLKCQEQHTVAAVHDGAVVRVETNAGIYQHIPVPSYAPPSGQNVYLNGYHTLGKRTFQARVTKNFTDSYSIETVIDGKPLRGVLFSNKPSYNTTTIDYSIRKQDALDIGVAEPNEDHNSSAETGKSIKQNVMCDNEVDGGEEKHSILPNPQVLADAVSDVKNPAASDVSLSLELPGDAKSSVVFNGDPGKNQPGDAKHSSSVVTIENMSAAAKDIVTSLPNQRIMGASP